MKILAIPEPLRSRLLVLGALALWAHAAEGAVQVVDEKGAPVPGAVIEACFGGHSLDGLPRLPPRPVVAKTDHDGVADVRVPSSGGVVIVDHPGFVPLLVTLDGRVPRRLELSRGVSWETKIRPRVAEPVDFEGAEVCATGRLQHDEREAGRPWRRCSEVGGEGGIHLVGLPQGELSIEVRLPGFLPTTTTVSPTGDLQLTVERGVQIEGRVVDRRGQAIRGATVDVSGGALTTTAADGTFGVAAPSLPARLSVVAAGFRAQAVEVSKSELFVVELEPGESVTATLLDHQGLPIGDEEVEAWLERILPTGTRRTSRHSVELDEGRFRFDLPAAGHYALRLRIHGHRELHVAPLLVGPGETHDLGVLGFEAGGAIRAHLIDADTAAPLEGALVEVVPVGAMVLQALRTGGVMRDASDRAGVLAIGGLEEGRYLVRIAREGSAPVPLLVDVGHEEIVDLGSLGLDEGVVVAGRLLGVEEDDRGGLTVELFDQAHELITPLASAVTNAAGHFELPPVAAGRYRLRVVGERALLAQEIELRRGRPRLTVELRLHRPRVSGRVVRDGLPAGGGLIRLSSLLDPADRRGKMIVRRDASAISLGGSGTATIAHVAADGTFEIVDAPAGPVSLLHAAPNGERVYRQLSLPADGTRDLVIELAGHSLRGRVVAAATAEGLAGQLHISDGLGRHLVAVPTDGEGWFEIFDLAAGRYRVEARVEGYSPAILDQLMLPRAEQEPVLLEVERRRPGRLEVRLARPSGTSLAGVPTSLFDAQGTLVRALPTRAGGRLELEDIPPGEYFVAWAEPYAGAGIAPGVEVGGSREPLVEPALGRGTSVVLECPLHDCAGRPVEMVVVHAAHGPDLTPLLSGVEPGLRFSEEGDLSLGRLAAGRYRFQLWVAGQSWEREATVSAVDSRVRLH